MCVLLSNHLQQLMQDHQSKNHDHAESTSSSMHWSVVDDNARTPDQELLKKLQESSSSKTWKGSLNNNNNMSLIDAVAARDGTLRHPIPPTALSSSSSTKKEDVVDASNDLVVNALLQQAADNNISIPSLILGGRRACSHDTGLELYATCGRRRRCMLSESMCSSNKMTTTTTMANDSWTVLHNVDQVLSILWARSSPPPNILINNEDKVGSSCASMKNVMTSSPFSRCASHESFLTTVTFRQGRRPGSKW